MTEQSNPSNGGRAQLSRYQIPLWMILVVPFTVIVTVVVTLTSYLSVQNSQTVVNNIAEQLMGEITIQIESQLQSFLHAPALINQTNAQAVREGWLDVSDADALGRYFWRQVQVYDSVTSIYFGNPDGGLVSGGREGGDGSLYIIQTDHFKSGPLNKYATDPSGQPTDLLVAVPQFDARLRPWYIGAVERGGPAWTDPYVLSTGQDLALAASQPVYDSGGQLLGVVSVDIFISHVTQFLESLEIGQSGQTYILEQSGYLVASSTGVLPFRHAEDGTWQRLQAAESDDPVIAASAEYLAGRFGDLSTINHQERLTASIRGEPYYVWVTPYHDSGNFDWLIVILIPEDDFLGPIRSHNRVTLFLTIGAAALAVLSGLLTAFQVSRPVSRLSVAARALAQGDWSQTVPIQGVQEVRQLGRSFNMMAAQLYEAFSHLEEHVRSRTADLEASEARYRAIVEDQTDLICRFRLDNTLSFVNDAYCRYFGKTREQLIGKSFMPRLPEADQRRVAESVARLTCDDSTDTIEHQAIKPDGQVRWMQWVNHALFDEQGHLVEIQSVGRDITDHKQYEEALQKALARETELSELKSHFISTVSHEFRTPLTVILSSTGILRRYSDKMDREKQAEHLLRIQAQIQHMAGLLDGVLAINRAERGKAEFDPVTLDLAALCQNIIGEARTTAPTTLSFELVCTGSCTEVKADPKLLQLIISNLISNAVKYSRPGGKVTIGLACHAHQSILSVQDEGMGIPKEAQPHVFEPFYRADNVGDLAGTGLGLAIVRQCVEQHGGTVSFTSEAERGTTFVVTLPNIAFMERQYGENFDH